MESNLRPSASVSSRMSSIDVSQLDKINAIPNKTSNNVLIDGLCLEDKLYLETLMDEESSDSDDNDDTPNVGGSPWSPPMAERPMVMGPSKRMKRMKSSYAITLSLEDISYIRPSWGMSKGGIKRIDKKTSSRKLGGTNKKTTTSTKLAETKSAAAAATATKDKAGIRIDELDSDNKSIQIHPYHLFLASIIVILAVLMILSYIVDLSRYKERTYQYRIELHPAKREFDIFKQKDGVLSHNRGLKVNYGRGIPGNLKHEECSCEMYDSETRKYYPNKPAVANENCFACFDWAQRANMQMFINRSQYDSLLNYQHSSMIEEDPAITCYDIKWQSYDNLKTPIVDCFRIGDEQWFGLGDIQTPLWPLNKFDQGEFAPLITNLSAEFNNHYHPIGFLPKQLKQQQQQHQQVITEQRVLNFGSQVDLSLITSNGFFIGNLKTDLQPSIKISASTREICLSVSCLDKCTQLWSRHNENSDRLRFENNQLEYSICSASSWRLLSLRLVDERIKALGPTFVPESTQSTAGPHQSATTDRHINATASNQKQSQRLSDRPRARQADLGQDKKVATTEIESPTPALNLVGGSSGGANSNNKSTQSGWAASSAAPLPPSPLNQLLPNEKRRQQPDGVGLVERTIFKTSPEYIDNLDGQTLRQYVDKIVKLNLKTSPVLLIDTRWQTYVGSFKLNVALFPKAKLLFEILHNKGFKIVMSVKPYIDINIGISNLNQLLEHNRLVTAQYESDLQLPALATHTNLPTIDYGPLVDGQQESISSNFTTIVVRRKSFFVARNETVYFKDRLERQMATKRKPYLLECRESYNGHCVLIDLVSSENRAWLIELIKRSTFLSQEADAILLGGTHPDSLQWQNHYRHAMFQLVDDLFLKESLYVIPQWSGNFNYIQLAARQRDWNALRSVVDSVLYLGMQGVSLIHPGSVWGDIKSGSTNGAHHHQQWRQPETAADAPGQPISTATTATATTSTTSTSAKRFMKLTSPTAAAASATTATTTTTTTTATMDDLSGQPSDEQREEELIVRWLQVAVFLPILQFNDLTPIDKYNLHEQVQNLVKIRKLYIVPEIKKYLPYTPLINRNFDEFTRSRPAHQQQLAALRHTWYNVLIDTDLNADTVGSGNGGSGGWQANEAVGQQFMIGSDMLVAPVLQEGQRQKDIYLPGGIWHDELRQTNIRGGKWLRNYPIELNEIAWFTRARRR